MKVYVAIVWVADPDVPGKRVSVVAENSGEALTKLEAEFGQGNVFDLHNEDEARQPR